ncbi:MAG: lipoyl(octanoyl) transferase LipB, partial [Candidatus Tectomicrobia bacterium]|nr:lipoyl(octanoyl) transferase LipB [Candidatus Tectomicrobia bacterium]
HGPGQLVGYPILDLNDHGRDAHLYLRWLEAVLIETLNAFDIQAERRAGLTGVWVGHRKIASIGVHLSRWVTWHGFALNVDMDLSPFQWIVPCGIAGVEMVSMASLLGKAVSLEEVTESVMGHFCRIFP